MREILFRGQTRRLGDKVNLQGEKQPGIWVYGGIFYGKGDFSIIYGGETENEIEKFAVYSDTVGQYTGRTDKNKKRIFDGDIIKTRFDTVLIKWANTGFMPYRNKNGTFTKVTNWESVVNGEVIGNICDNPELLGVTP